MEKLNKHGLPIMNVSVKSKRTANDIRLCDSLEDEICYREPKHVYGEHKYCERCYLKILDR